MKLTAPQFYTGHSNPAFAILDTVCFNLKAGDVTAGLDPSLGGISGNITYTFAVVGANVRVRFGNSAAVTASLADFVLPAGGVYALLCLSSFAPFFSLYSEGAATVTVIPMPGVPL